MSYLKSASAAVMILFSALGVNAATQWYSELSALPFIVRSVPDFAVDTVAHGTLRRDDLCGKPAIVNIWATWCVPCITEAPELVKLQSMFLGKVQVLGISVDEIDADAPHLVARFATKHGLNFPVFLANQQLRDVLPQSDVLPVTYLVNEQCQMVRQWLGRVTYGQLSPEVDDMLKSSSLKDSRQN